MDSATEIINGLTVGTGYISALHSRIQEDWFDGEVPPSCQSPMLTSCDGSCVLSTMAIHGKCEWVMYTVYTEYRHYVCHVVAAVFCL